ncbi:DUF5133 domain-containing protein [Streptomyces sp. MB09-01]|uniref:DUF5133 domain-containing protein n=1 Tax=Streptomyces sp. MB09-01 TaxID=3028666 RepID=UPI0029B94D36|nr:DUF5133 domain-containing protein [Streptomyces sp. MB09-01]MDX3539955.1 DUF5133 domain-containing protein [Streptomyces sp. MB09-01]
MSASAPRADGTRTDTRARPAHPMSEPAHETAIRWAVGTLMATTPAPAREAEAILSAAAARAGLPEAALAAAMRQASRGVPVPARAERALRQAVQAARTATTTAPPPSGPYLVPLRADAEKALGRYFEDCLRLQAAPADADARRAFEDSLFTLCVLMGRPSAAAALHEAIQYTEG